MTMLKVYGKKTASKIQGGDKSMVTALNTTELKKIFGENGEYAGPYVRVFDATTSQFYFLFNYNGTSDSVNPLNWKPVSPGAFDFPEYSPAPYLKGSPVMKTESNGDVDFYIATMGTTSSEVPGESSKWFKFSTGSGNAGVIPRQIEYGSINKNASEGTTGRKMNFNISNEVSLNGNRIPIVQILIHTINDNYELAYPNVIISKSSGISISIEFKGDLSILNSDTNNVIVTLI